MQAPVETPVPARARGASLALSIDAAWRALAYCLHPRVIYLSLLPLILAALSLSVLTWLAWEPALAGVRHALDAWGVSHTVLGWMDGVGLGFLRLTIAPFLLVLVAVPLVLIACLLLVAGLMTPSLVQLVRQRRFPHMLTQVSTPWWHSLLWSLGASLSAMGLFVLSLPLWLIPLFALLIPPLIWGWLTYRVLAFDTLADLATREERAALLKAHRPPLLGMGIVCGYLGAAPAGLMGALAMVMSPVALVFLAPLILVGSVWVYTLVFAYSSLWFAHFLLPALVWHRQQAAHAMALPLEPHP